MGQVPVAGTARTEGLARRGSSGAGTRTEADLLLEDSLFHGQRVLAVSEDLHLPHWFTDALCVATVQGRGGIGKQVNWPVFVHEYPMHIQHMAKRMNAPSAMFDELRAWAAAEELQPSFDADFYMERGGSIGGWSFTFWTNKEPSPAQIDEATTITARHNHEPSWIEPVMEETNNGEGGGKRARWTYYL